LTDRARRDRGAPSRSADYDLHGIVGVRVVGTSARDVAAVNRQLGPIQARLDRDPDITIRFVDRLSLRSRLRYVGLDDAGFTDDEFLVVRRRPRRRAYVRFPFDELGGACEIMCESGISAVPHLIATINLTALAKGFLPLHASAFTYRGTGALVTGWAKGGKTEVLLGYMANGAEYVGDEWVYVDPDGKSMYGIPEPITIWDWHLDDLPRYRALIERRDRWRFRAIRAVQLVEGAIPSRADDRGRLAKLVPLAERQLYTRMSPERLFGRSALALQGTLDKVFFVASHDQPDIVVEPIDPSEVAGRLGFSLEFEGLELHSAYLKYRFAFPESTNALLESAVERRRSLLARALEGKPAYAVYHPFPAPIPGLFDAIRPLLDGDG